MRNPVIVHHELAKPLVGAGYGIDHHAYRGAPRRIGSNWSGIESNPPDEHGWSEHNKKRNWNWRPVRKHNPRPQLTPKQQAEKLLAKLLGEAK